MMFHRLQFFYANWSDLDIWPFKPKNRLPRYECTLTLLRIWSWETQLRVFVNERHTFAASVITKRKREDDEERKVDWSLPRSWSSAPQHAWHSAFPITQSCILCPVFAPIKPFSKQPVINVGAVTRIKRRGFQVRIQRARSLYMANGRDT